MRTLYLVSTFSIALLLASAAHAQVQSSRQNPPSSSQEPGHPTISSDADEARERQAQELARKANLERQAALKKDTDKLLKLAVELKDYVDKSNENVLSLNVMKKADEIEKLAHSVKDKMKGPN